MKVVIPGGSGQVGTILARALGDAGHEVVVLSRQSRPAPWRVVHWDGETPGEWCGEIDGADVRVGLRYLAVPLVRSGASTIIDVLEGGTLQGELGPLGLLAGILESPEFHAAELATGRHGFALAVIGELWSNPVWTEALERLAGETAVT